MCKRVLMCVLKKAWEARHEDAGVLTRTYITGTHLHVPAIKSLCLQQHAVKGLWYKANANACDELNACTRTVLRARQKLPLCEAGHGVSSEICWVVNQVAQCTHVVFIAGEKTTQYAARRTERILHSMHHDMAAATQLAARCRQCMRAFIITLSLSVSTHITTACSLR